MKKVWFFLFAVLSPFVVAQGSGGTVNPGGTGGTINPQPSITDPLGVGGISGLFNKIIDGLLLLAGPIAVIMLVYAGYLFIIAQDNQDRIKKARATVLYVVIGVAILVMSKAIVYVACDFLGVKCTP